LIFFGLRGAISNDQGENDHPRHAARLGLLPPGVGEIFIRQVTLASKSQGSAIQRTTQGNYSERSRDHGNAACLLLSIFGFVACILGET
jgi:hypothetical protein